MEQYKAQGTNINKEQYKAQGIVHLESDFMTTEKKKSDQETAILQEKHATQNTNRLVGEEFSLSRA